MRRKKHNLSREKSDALQGKRIGVLGLGAGCGTTHISLALANYISDYGHKSVCLMERSGRDDMKWLFGEASRDNEKEFFCHHRVTYSFFGNSQDSGYLLGKSFDCTVFDLGHNRQRAMHFLKLCDLRLVVGVAAEWRRQEYAYVKELCAGLADTSSWKLLINLCDEKAVKEFSGYGLRAYGFPYEGTPVYPGELTAAALERVLV